MEQQRPDISSPNPPAAPSSALSGLAPGEVFGLELNGYTFREKLGEGGFAQVWLAHHAPLDRDVAVKLFKKKVKDHSEDLLTQIAQKEAKLHGRLPETLDVPRVHDFFRCPPDFAGDAYAWALVMQHIGGESLQDRLSRLLAKYCRSVEALRRRLADGQEEWATADRDVEYAAYKGEMRELVGAFADVVRTAGGLHRRGIVHLDITPWNIRADEQGRLYLLDCGLARNISPEGQATAGLSQAKSHQYCSPEQSQNGPLDAKSDIYALGATLSHILCLLPPNSGAELLPPHSFTVKRDGGVPADRINATLDPGIARVAATAMAKAPEDRYADAEGMYEAIKAWLRSPGDEQPLAEALGSLNQLLLDGMKDGLTEGGAIAYTSRVAAEKWLDLYRLVQYGLLRMETDGFRLHHLARGSAWTFSELNGEEWVEKLAMGHLATLLLKEDDHLTVNVDAGSTTLWGLRAMFFHDLCRHMRFAQIHTNNLIALSETKNLSLETDWFGYGGRIERRTNAITENVAAAISEGAVMSAAVVGINALRTMSPSQKGLWPVELVTHTGNEGPIKEAMIRKALKVFVVLNPKKFGCWDKGLPLRPEANFPELLSGTKRLTLVTSVPFRYPGEDGKDHEARRSDFLANVRDFAAHVPKGRFTVTLFAVPLVPERLARVAKLADLHPEVADPADLPAAVAAMSRRFADHVFCVGLDHSSIEGRSTAG